MSEKRPRRRIGRGGVSTQCGRPLSIFLIILIKQLGERDREIESSTHEARHCVEMRVLGEAGEPLI